MGGHQAGRASNGQLRTIQVRDHSVAADLPVAEKPIAPIPPHRRPFAGVVTLAVREGEPVAAGATVATIETMKMEAAITSNKSKAAIFSSCSANW